MQANGREFSAAEAIAQADRILIAAPFWDMSFPAVLKCFFEQATPYLKALGALWNLGRLTTIAAQNMDYSTPEEIEEKIAAATAEGLRLAKRW